MTCPLDSTLKKYYCDVSDVSKKNMKRIKPIGWILIGISSVILVLVVWLLLPVKNTAITRYFPDNTAGVIVINIDRENPAVEKILTDVKTKIKTSGMSSVKKNLITTFYNGLIPKRVVVVYVQNPASTKPEYMAFVSLGRISKLLAFAGGPINDVLFNGKRLEAERFGLRKMVYAESSASELNPAARIFVGNTILVSNNPDLISSVFTDKASEDRTAVWEDYLTFIEDTPGDIHLSLSNSDGGLSPLVKKIEEDFAFSAFPSIDAVEKIEGEGFFEMEQIDINARFHSNDAAEIDQIKSDVRFLYGAMRRIVKSFDITMKGNVDINKESVDWSFYLENYRPALYQSFNISGE